MVYADILIDGFVKSRKTTFYEFIFVDKPVKNPTYPLTVIPVKAGMTEMVSL